VSQLAYRARLARPPRRRRRYRSYRLSRWATFGTGAAVPLGGWLYLGEPLRWAGLGAMAVAGEAVIPVAVLFALYFLPALVMGGLVPRKWRIRHRLRHGRELCRSAYISAGLRRVVLAMDRDRCLYCGVTARELAAMPPRRNLDGRVTPRRLHVDHGCPWRAGGLTVLLNMVALCDEHNEIKLNWWRERNGYVWYRPQARNRERLAMAELITVTIRRRRWNPLRLLRAAWAMG
jgi:hypothetical protein